MKSYTSIAIGIFIIATANVLGHFLPPFSLFTTFMYMSLIVGLVNFKLYTENFKITAAYNFVLLLVNDFLIRLYAGGTHDSAGMAWCWLMFQFGFVISSILMIVFSLTFFKKETAKFSNFRIVVFGCVCTQVFYNFVNAKI